MIKHRVDFTRRILNSLIIILVLISSISIVMGEDPSIITRDRLEVTLGTIHQLEVEIGEPVLMYQELTIKNPRNETINATISLLDYPEMIPEVYLDEYVSLTISSEGEMHSAQPVLPVIISPYSMKEYILEYEFLPVYKDVDCVETTIQDLLPTDALVLPSTLPPETVIEKKCNVKIHHEGEIHYYNVEVTLEELEGEKINSIYYIEGDTYLKLKDGVISLAEK